MFLLHHHVVFHGVDIKLHEKPIKISRQEHVKQFIYMESPSEEEAGY